MSAQFVNELEKAFRGSPWHGDNVLTVIKRCAPHSVFSHPVPGAHGAAEVVLHLTAWTREIISRLSGGRAGEPAMGDWPPVREQTESYWHSLISDFEASNAQLLQLVREIPAERWHEPVQQPADAGEDYRLTYFELLNGLIQHHAYHAGQIALLSKY